MTSSMAMAFMCLRIILFGVANGSMTSQWMRVGNVDLRLRVSARKYT
jgi:hypothetical protein